jgi:AmmeMemoRadiSam system protein B
MWYPIKKEALEKQLSEFLEFELVKKHKNSGIKGIIVPHAGYEFSGKLAARAYAQIKGAKKAIILAPSHYFPLNGIVSHDDKSWQTPLGQIEVINFKFRKANLTQEHAIDNQVPFLQKLGFKQILPLVVGNINDKDAEFIARQINPLLKDPETILVVSTDLSHFLPENYANIKDKETVRVIEKLDIENSNKIEACGIFPLMVFMHLAKMNNWKPELIKYQTSAEINKDISKVVGYCIMKF